MPRLIFRDADGRETIIDATAGLSVMEVARDNGVSGIVAECNGGLACATCHCYFPADLYAALPEPAATELEMLEFAASPQRPTSRLSCQVIVTEAMDGSVIDLPAAQV